MLNIFGGNMCEVGSLLENLVLNTAGKIKIRFGNRFIDLLDNKGNINVLFPKVISKTSSIENIKSNGIYLVGDTLYAYVDKTLIPFSKESNEIKKEDIEENSALVYILGSWQYIPIVTLENYNKLEQIIIDLSNELSSLEKNINIQLENANNSPNCCLNLQTLILSISDRVAVLEQSQGGTNESSNNGGGGSNNGGGSSDGENNNGGSSENTNQYTLDNNTYYSGIVSLTIVNSTSDDLYTTGYMKLSLAHNSSAEPGHGDWAPVHFYIDGKSGLSEGFAKYLVPKNMLVTIPSEHIHIRIEDNEPIEWFYGSLVYYYNGSPMYCEINSWTNAEDNRLFRISPGNISFFRGGNVSINVLRKDNTQGDLTKDDNQTVDLSLLYPSQLISSSSGNVSFTLYNRTNSEIRLSGKVVLNISTSSNDWSNVVLLEIPIPNNPPSDWATATNTYIISPNSTLTWRATIDGNYLNGNYYLLSIDKPSSGLFPGTNNYRYEMPVYLYCKYYSVSRGSVQHGNGMYHTNTLGSKLAANVNYVINVDYIRTEALLADNSTKVSTLTTNNKSYGILPPGKLELCPEDIGDYTETGLPIIIINTGGREIPDPKAESYLENNYISIIDEYGEEVYENDYLEIKGRGNSSWYDYPKKPYNLKLFDAVPLLNMSSSKKWALLANYADRTLIRNKISSEIAKCTKLSSGMGWVPDGKFVELVLDGTHLGTYYLSERVEARRTRVPATGRNDYLFEIDRYEKYGSSFFYSAIKGFPYHILGEVTGLESTIRNIINTMEANLAAVLPGHENEYSNYIDYNSAADYWIVEELCLNFETRNTNDVLPGSVWCYYLGSTGKLKMGPPWDFDYSTFNINWPLKLGNTYCNGTVSSSNGYAAYMPEILILMDRLYYDYLFNDLEFKAIVKHRWNSIYSDLQGILNRFDWWYNYLLKSEAINWSYWPLPNNFEGGHHPDCNYTFRNAITAMHNFYQARLSFMNTFINNFPNVWPTLMGDIYSDSNGYYMRGSDDDVTRSLVLYDGTSSTISKFKFSSYTSNNNMFQITKVNDITLRINMEGSDFGESRWNYPNAITLTIQDKNIPSRTKQISITIRYY